MTTDTVIDVKVHKNNIILKNISEPVQLNNKNWTEYNKSLKTIQKNVNVYLTELVDLEKSAGENVITQEDECDESDEEDESTAVKRKSENFDNINKKLKK